MKIAKVLAAGMLTATLFAACDKGTVEPTQKPGIAIAADSVNVEEGSTASVAVTLFRTTEQAQFVSRNQNVAVVSATGVVSGVSPGGTYIIATLPSNTQAHDSIFVRVTEKLNITGTAVPGMVSFDQIFTDLIKKHKIPGGAVAVMRDGKLIYARGFGYADVENKKPVQPDALFRVASMSKPVTSAAIMKLIEEGKLTLDDRVAPLIEDLTPAPGATVDPRWDLVTIRMLLNHSGGWDRDKPGGFDPMSLNQVAAQAVGAPMPATAETIIRYMKGKPFDFEPGEKYVYSNFGFGILGAVIERVSGMKYEDYVRSRVLFPVGANRARSGRTRMSEAYAGEVKYYWPGAGINQEVVQSVYPGDGIVPVNYGGYSMEAMYASGAWVFSTMDYLRFVSGIDGNASRPDILKSETITQMTAKANGANILSNGSFYYAGGWFVRPSASQTIFSHAGTLWGTTGHVIYYQNIAMVVLFNTTSFTANLELESYNALMNALNSVSSFPTHDLFSQFQ